VWERGVPREEVDDGADYELLVGGEFGAWDNVDMLPREVEVGCVGR
jgi:hypothetical protein